MNSVVWGRSNWLTISILSPVVLMDVSAIASVKSSQNADTRASVVLQYLASDHQHSRATCGSGEQNSSKTSNLPTADAIAGDGAISITIGIKHEIHVATERLSVRGHGRLLHGSTTVDSEMAHVTF